MKKILIFSLAYHPGHVGGAEVALNEITNRLGNEYEFDMVTLSCGNCAGCAKSEELIGRVQVYRIGGWIGRLFGGSRIAPGNFGPVSKIKYPFLAFLRGSLLHRDRKYDIVWSMMAAHAGLAGLFFKLTHPRVKFLLTLQEGLSAEEMNRIARPIWPLFKMIFLKADAIQAISKYLADFAKQEVGVTQSVTIIPNGVDFDRFANTQASKETGSGLSRDEMRERYGFTKDDFVLVTTSRLVPKNGVGDVIDALALSNISTSTPRPIKFLILGQGPLESELRSKVDSLGLSNRVVFAGFVENQNLPAILAACDAFIRPSLSEGFGISFIEAMAAGLPVIATQVGGISDFLIDPSQDNSPDGSLATGLACQPGNPESISAAISKISSDSSLSARLVNNARQMVKNRYDWNVVVGGMRGIFNKI